jgi:hypothetical protein
MTSRNLKKNKLKKIFKDDEIVIEIKRIYKKFYF